MSERLVEVPGHFIPPPRPFQILGYDRQQELSRDTRDSEERYTVNMEGMGFTPRESGGF